MQDRLLLQSPSIVETKHTQLTNSVLEEYIKNILFSGKSNSPWLTRKYLRPTPSAIHEAPCWSGPPSVCPAVLDGMPEIHELALLPVSHSNEQWEHHVLWHACSYAVTIKKKVKLRGRYCNWNIRSSLFYHSFPEMSGYYLVHNFMRLSRPQSLILVGGKILWLQGTDSTRITTLANINTYHFPAFHG